FRRKDRRTALIGTTNASSGDDSNSTMSQPLKINSNSRPQAANRPALAAFYPQTDWEPVVML
ncbi:MAG: hypothetical protein ACQKBT_11160, partial [Puniceicoccales bacterium]